MTVLIISNSTDVRIILRSAQSMSQWLSGSNSLRHFLTERFLELTDPVAFREVVTGKYTEDGERKVNFSDA